MNHRLILLSFFCFWTLNTLASCAVAMPKDAAAENGNWPNYANDKASSKYSALHQINRSNVNKLKVAWRWTSPDQKILRDNAKLFTFLNEATPLAIDGFLYVSTSMGQVDKIDGASGKSVWQNPFDPQAYRDEFPPNNGYVHRGITYWKDTSSSEERIFIGTGNAYLIALDAKTGRPVKSFGKDGSIDLLQGLNVDGTAWPNRWHYGVTSPVTICHDVIIVGSSNMDGTSKKKSVRGDVRAFDVKTGKWKWTFHTIPIEGDPATQSWKNDSWKYSGNSNVWTMMSADEEADNGKGFVYLPVSTPTNDFYGKQREGDNLYAESLVCLSCIDGAKKWHFQMTHHGLWDYDPPAAPNLVDIKVGGKAVKAVVQVTKQAFAFVLNRITGEPIWPILEKTVPQSKLEWSSPTQPFPTRPLAFDRQGVFVNDLISFSDKPNSEICKNKSSGLTSEKFCQDTNELNNFKLFTEAKAVVDQYEYGPLYTPPTDQKKGALLLPGWIGGASWAGAAYSPVTGRLYVSSITNPYSTLLVKTKADPDDPNTNAEYARDFVKSFITNPDGKSRALPLFKPPYGRITSIDLNTGDFDWQEPLGEGPRQDPLIKEVLPKSEWANKRLGWPRRGHLLLTDDILFVGQSGDFFLAGAAPKLNAIKVAIRETEGEQNLKALSPETGAILAEMDLTLDSNGKKVPGASGNAYGAPMTYLDANGDQIIVVPVGGANLPAELVGLKLTH